MRRALAVALAVVAATAAPAAAGPVPEAVAYRPPVEAPVVDPFRPPPTPFAAGNRGVDYATAPGTPVGAPAAGVVTFAGPVGAGLHVVILHADGVRTSLSFLASVEVRRGDRVAAGDPVGTSGPSLHFGARAGDTYLDPLVLLDGGGVSVRLVPDGPAAMASEGDERNGLVRLLGGLGRATAATAGAAVDWARAGVATAGAATTAAGSAAVRWANAVAPVDEPPGRWLAVAVSGWVDRRRQCTPAGPAPPRPPGRRRVVLVAGLGSSSREASVYHVDTAALGYAGADVVRFSYRGGTTEERPYDAADTQADLRLSGRRLRALLDRMAADDPSTPIDVIAHSQGGLVARIALGDRPPAAVEHLVTLASPHQGADLATALDLARRRPAGAVAEAGLGRARIGGIDPTSASVRQLSELSGLVAELDRHPLPPGVAVTSIAARGDVVVPSPRSRLDGATNVVIRVDGLWEHPLVPASPAATREMALALAGLPPTCETLADALADAAAGRAVDVAESGAGVLVLVGMPP